MFIYNFEKFFIIKIVINNLDNDLVFQLKNKRFVDRQSINILKNQGILTTIH